MGYKYKGVKSRGKHTTYLDTTWVRKFLKQVQREDSVTGIYAGIIVWTGKNIRADYAAKRISVGIELFIFGSSAKQQIFLYTKDPDLTAQHLGLVLREGK